VNLLGGKSVNGNPILFPYDDSVEYHIYWDILNAKDYDVPQNRERVFIVGIRDDSDNNFRFPTPQRLSKNLKDILETSVDDKYFLSQTTIQNLIEYDTRQKENGNGFGTKFHSTDGIMSSLKVGGGYCDDLIKTEIENCKYGLNTCMNHQYGLCVSCQDGDNYELDYSNEDNDGFEVRVKSATSKGYEQATIGDSINFNATNSETRRGRVGKGVAQILDTFCKQAVVYKDKRLNETLQSNELPSGKPMILDTWNKSIHSESPSLKARHPENNDRKLWDGYKIRRLTPRECFRIMDFPDSFTWTCSDTQAYKQAGNSIVVNVLYKILKNLNL
jgi:DNA (cytosine-5)-methyltransferase 1